MKTKHFLPFIAMAIGMGSCTNDLVDETNPLMGKRDVIAVSVDNADTRTAMEDNNVVWSTDDAIGIFAGSMNNAYSLSSGAGTTSAEFTGLAPQSLKEAAYFPFVESATWANNVISTTLPTAYTYSAESNNNAVMAALMAEDAQSSISFQNAGALYAITVENIPAGYDKAVMTYLGADDKVGIAGAATITFVDGVPTLAVPEAADAASAEKTITITFTGTGSKTFYFPMPVIDVETFPGLQFSLRGEDETTINVPAYTKKPQRNKLYAETWTLDNVSGGIVSEANDIEAANAALANDAVTSVVVKDLSGTEPITIPAKSESADVPHTIDLSEAELPTGDNKLTINVDNTTDNTTVKELTVVVPDEETAGNLVINAPGTTVTIQSANGTIIETIEATTAENTLIIGTGVTVNSLTINKGNVVLEDGASVGKFLVKDAAGFKTAIGLGGKIELQNAIDLNVTSGTLTIPSGKEVVIDLKDFTLTTSASTNSPATDDITVVGKLSISNGIIKSNNTAFYVNGGELALEDCEIKTPSKFATVYAVSGKVTAEEVTAEVANTAFFAKGGTMTLTNCKVISSAGGYNVVAVSDNGTLTIDGGSYTSVENEVSHDESYTICVRKSTAEISTTASGGNGGITVLDNSTVTLTGGSYSGVKACGLYVKGSSTVTYTSDCTFSGVEGDIVVGETGIVNGTSYTEYTKINQVSTPDELKSIIANGGYAILANSIDLNVTSGTLTIPSGKEVVIDLKDFTLTTSASTNSPATDDITVVGKLSISNGIIKSNNTAFYVNGGELALEDCEIKTPSKFATVYAVSGKVTAEEVTAEVANTAFFAKGGTMTLTNCEVISSAGGYNVVAVSDNGILTIDGGSYTSVENDASHDESYTICVRKSTAEISTTASGGNGGITVLDNSTVELTGGSYSGVKACGLYVKGSSTVTYTSDCTFSGPEAPIKVADTESSATQN